MSLNTKNNKIIEDPRQDNIKLETKKSDDIVALYMEMDSDKNLNILLEMDGNIEEDTVYNVNAILFYRDEIKRLNLKVENNSVSLYHVSKQSIDNIDGVTANIKGKVISITLPNSIMGEFESIFINAHTSVGDIMIDKTSWRMVSNY